MKIVRKFCTITLLSAAICVLNSACSKSQGKDSDQQKSITDSLNTQDADSVNNEPKQEIKVPEPGDEDYKFPDNESIVDYVNNGPNAALYKGGIIPVIAENVPEYAEKLIANQHPRFIVVDKASMNVILYDKYGQLEKIYGCACAKNYGTKHEKADSRTPEGFFTAEGIYNSTDWLFTDDDGYTSPKKGQFGPRFIRLKTPVTMQIGIHGTGSPGSIGHRVSHGCIRITNDNILELVKYAEKGMPIIVNPGKRDREVNRNEGYNIPYFPTDNKYAMTAAEKKLSPRSALEIEKEKKMQEEKERLEAEKMRLDSLNNINNKSLEESSKPLNVTPEEENEGPYLE